MAYSGMPNNGMMGMQNNPGIQNNPGMQAPLYMQNPQYNPQWQQGNNYSPNQQPFKIVPVASIDEAKAIPTDFMGTMLVMPDFSHGAIYTKILDINTGNPAFRIFKYTPEEAPAPAYDARKDIESLRAELNKLKSELGIKEHDADEHA